MNTYPLVRAKWSNEHIMAAVFGVLVLYNLPQWVQDPSDIPVFILVVLAGLAVDEVINFVRFKKPVCAVSAAVTAAILHVLTYSVPLWGQLAGVIVALVLGKQIWGGTGKNIVNPAVTGLLFVVLIFGMKLPLFSYSVFLIPAVLLSLAFIKIRPFAGAGFILGMIAALLFNQALTISNVLSFGVFFWGCLVLTDPVTVTYQPFYGLILGLFGGFTSLLFYPSAVTICIIVLSANLFSFVIDNALFGTKSKVMIHFRIKRIVPFLKEDTPYHDLTGEKLVRAGSNIPLDKETILNRILKNEVYGLGGAGFSAYQKISAVLKSGASRKYFIINGVECDPGLIHDKWLLRKYPDEIYKGMMLLCSCVDFSSVTLAVKDMEGLNYPKKLEVKKVRDYFPAGAERLLIKEILGIQVESDKIPSQAGILVLNVQTVYSIFEAVYKDKKSDTKFLTAANLVDNKGQVLKVRLGMKINDVIKEVYPGYACTFSGGGLMQGCTADEEDVIGKNVNFIAVGKFPRYKESSLCSKCGRCSMYCPAGIEVSKIASLVDEGKLSKTVKYHPEKCIGCGSCSFSCLAGKNLSARIKKAKEYTSELQNTI